MKKTLAMILALVMMLSLASSFPAFAEEEVEEMTEERFEEIYDEIEYEPNPDYDKYTVVYYFLEDISADLNAMVSANEDETEFYIEVFWYGVDDQGLVKYDGENYEIVEDKSGFMKLVAPPILDIAIAQDYWKPIGGMTEEEFQEFYDDIEYEPNPDYDKYTVAYYFLEDISADLNAMVSANEEETEFYIEVFWYGVDDQGLVKYDGENYEIVEDKSGFMKLVAPPILDIAIAQNYWKPIEKAA